MESNRKVIVIDSHTEGEATRVILEGGPNLGSCPINERVRELKTSYDGFRSGVVQEPRGTGALVGALMLQPSVPGVDASVIFFNNVGYLGMCGHGTIGLVTTLDYLGRCEPGELKIETPVGIVRAMLHEDGKVTVYNIASYRYRRDACVDVPSYGEITGDVAYGGNWFFITKMTPVPLLLSNRAELSRYTADLRRALEGQGITGENKAPIDHIHLTGLSEREDMNGKNFVLCPGGEFDRSPCGTGTCARLACLAEDGDLAPGEIWRQESICGTHFDASYEISDGRIYPNISGRAYITAEATLIFDPSDPLQNGMWSSAL